jgi:hypothetical protein
MRDTLVVMTTYTDMKEFHAFQAIHYQMEDPGNHFLELRTEPNSGETELGLAHDDLMAMLGKMEDAVSFIEAENDGQDDDLIKLGFITDLNSEIDDIEDGPSFAQDWETIHDVIAWVEEVLSGPYTINEEIDEQPLEIKVNLSAWLTNPVQDWKDKLPYHQWRPEEEWMGSHDSWPWTEENWNETGEYTYWDWETGENYFFENIGWIVHINEEFGMQQPIDFLNGPDGAIIDIEETMPYLPDYTLGGLFPEMGRPDWLELLGYE